MSASRLLGTLLQHDAQGEGASVASTNVDQGRWLGGVTEELSEAGATPPRRLFDDPPHAGGRCAEAGRVRSTTAWAQPREVLAN